MKNIVYILIALNTVSCSTEVDNQSTQTDTAGADSVTEVYQEVPDRPTYESLHICDEVGDELDPHFKSYFTAGQSQLIERAWQEYPLISTDSAMATFYNQQLDTILAILNNGIWKYKDENDITDDGTYFTIYNSCMPFIEITWNGFEGSVASANLSELLTKSKATEGDGDETFFTCMNSFYGPFNLLSYNTLREGYCFGGQYPENELGNGAHVKILRQVILAESTSDKFNPALDGLVSAMMSAFRYDVDFAFSKREVMDEIDLMLGLQDRTKFDLTEAESLKTRLDTSVDSINYNRRPKVW